VARQLAEEAHAAPNSCALNNNRTQGKWTRKRWMWNQSRSNISWAEQKASLASSFPRSYPREPRPHRSAALILIATAIQTFVHCLCLCSRHFCFFLSMDKHFWFCYKKDTNVKPPGFGYKLMKPATCTCTVSLFDWHLLHN
jgi:hypothetical protein